MKCNVMLATPECPFGKPECLDQHRHHHRDMPILAHEHRLRRTLAAAAVVFAQAIGKTTFKKSLKMVVLG